jgi:hypothetical protein
VVLVGTEMALIAARSSSSVSSDPASRITHWKCVPAVAARSRTPTCARQRRGHVGRQGCRCFWGAPMRPNLHGLVGVLPLLAGTPQRACGRRVVPHALDRLYHDRSRAHCITSGTRERWDRSVRAH